MSHVVLLGDSIFDNGVYVPDGPAVIDQLRAALPDHWSATLLAVDGDITSDVHQQLKHLPTSASHLVVSCGGNDALGYMSVLGAPVDNISQALERFADIRADFRSKYGAMLAEIQDLECSTLVCTVYDSVPGLEPGQHAALAMFNEVILREAIGAGIDLLDLRLLCTEPADYSEMSPIEPSERGGEKITTAIAGILAGEVSWRRTVRVHA